MSCLCSYAVSFLYPLFWNLMSAFKTNAEYLTDPYALPADINPCKVKIQKGNCITA